MRALHELPFFEYVPFKRFVNGFCVVYLKFIAVYSYS